jgi:hypothetical protein
MSCDSCLIDHVPSLSPRVRVGDPDLCCSLDHRCFVDGILSILMHEVYETLSTVPAGPGTSPVGRPYALPELPSPRPAAEP